MCRLPTTHAVRGLTLSIQSRTGEVVFTFSFAAGLTTPPWRKSAKIKINSLTRHCFAPHLMVHCGDRDLERIMQKKAYSPTTDRVALNFGLTIPSVRPRSSSPAPAPSPSSKYISYPPPRESAPNGAFAAVWSCTNGEGKVEKKKKSSYP